jgi:hypothetical protein
VVDAVSRERELNGSLDFGELRQKRVVTAIEFGAVHLRLPHRSCNLGLARALLKFIPEDL